MWKDLKYLLAYIIPLSAIWGLSYGTQWAFATVVISFVFIPLLETFAPASGENLSETEASTKGKAAFFDVLLYLNVPLLYAILWLYLHQISTTVPTTTEWIGWTASVGIVMGSTGINVAHELGHKSGRLERILSKLLLLPTLYMHFIIEHNRGHHKWVGTPQDAATSRKGEHLYAFWWRSVTQGYAHAWTLENQRLRREQRSAWSASNEMVRFTIFQGLYLLAVGLLFSWSVVPWAILVAVIGFLLLETINYVEHYGLFRREVRPGVYEKVNVSHSWNSNHEVGRIMLYELVRHSDHHYKASRKYQILRHFDESPQLPFGYPTAIIVALIPPLWFRIMDGRVAQWTENHHAMAFAKSTA